MKPLDSVLLAIGLGLVLFVGYRSGIVKWNAKLIVGMSPTVVIASVLLFANYRINGTQEASTGLATGSAMLIAFFPMIIFAFWAMGEGMHLVRTFQPQVMEALRGGSGLVGSAVSGFAMPGSIMGLPIVKELWELGANREPLLLFILTSSLMNWQLVLFRQPMLGWEITAISFLASVAVSALLTVMAWVWMVASSPR